MKNSTGIAEAGAYGTALNNLFCLSKNNDVLISDIEKEYF
jgi:hypothetical protein